MKIHKEAKCSKLRSLVSGVHEQRREERKKKGGKNERCKLTERGHDVEVGFVGNGFLQAKISFKEVILVLK